MTIVPLASTARVFSGWPPDFLNIVEPSAARVTLILLLGSLPAVGLVMRKWPSAKSSIEANSWFVLPHDCTFSLMASSAYFSLSQLPTLNSFDGLELSGTPNCPLLSSLSQAVKPKATRAIRNETRVFLIIIIGF